MTIIKYFHTIHIAKAFEIKILLYAKLKLISIFFIYNNIKKIFKYKTKYLYLKNQLGGNDVKYFIYQDAFLKELVNLN